MFTTELHSPYYITLLLTSSHSLWGSDLHRSQRLLAARFPLNGSTRLQDLQKSSSLPFLCSVLHLVNANPNCTPFAAGRTARFELKRSTRSALAVSCSLTIHSSFPRRSSRRMAAVAGPSTPTPRKLSAIPEEGQSTPHRPLRRVSTKRRPPPALLGDETPPTPGSSGGSTPKLELGTTEEQLVLFAEAKALYTSGMDSLRKGKKGVRLALPLFRQVSGV